MQIAVLADLMAIGQDSLDDCRIPLDAPRGDEKGLLHLHLAVERENAGHRNAGSVLQCGHRSNQVVGVLVVRQVQDAVGIHIEGEGHRAAGPIGPGRSIGDQFAIDGHWVSRGSECEKLIRWRSIPSRFPVVVRVD